MYNDAQIGKYDDNDNLTGGIVNSSFIDNKIVVESDSTDIKAQGGAIFTYNDLNIISDNGTSLFSGNKTVVNGEEKSDAIYAGENDTVITLQAVNKGLIQFDDKIDGENGYKLNINGDKNSAVVINNNINNANISVEKTNLYVGNEDYLSNNESLFLQNANINLINKNIGTIHNPEFALYGTTDISVEADLEKETMDRITADEYFIHPDAILNVKEISLLSDAVKNKTDILFADEELAANVKYSGSSTVAYGNIWKYDVNYDPENGMFSFIRGAGSSANPSDDYNPAVLPSPVTTQAGAYTTQLQTYKCRRCKNQIRPAQRNSGCSRCKIYS